MLFSLLGTCLGRKNPPLSRCRTLLPCANAFAISREGARRLLWTLFALIIALNDSNPSVANKMAGPKRRICLEMWRMMWNLGLLNQRLVQRAVQSRKFKISSSSCFYRAINANHH